MRPLKTALATLVALTLATHVAVPAALARDALLGHRASYAISLKSAGWGAGITGFNGKLVVEFSNACDGYTLNQRLVSQMTNDEGQVAMGDLWLTSWESVRGETFRFTLSQDFNGASIDKFSGTAFTATDGARPRIEYSEGKIASAALPADAIFPTAYLIEVLEAAKAGQTTLARKVFDGSGEGETYQAFAVIGRMKAPGTELPQVEGASVLAGLASWPVTFSYYKLGGVEDVPDYEASFRLFANGVSTDLVLDFGDYAVNGTLEQLDTLSDPPC
ncbi:MAG TPA: DUF1849 family protein [Micropepsaceae bacterium]|nr:DUF1849 family protein [Micropepsaceae bacterium]